MAAIGPVPVWDGLLAGRVVGQEQLPDAEVVLDGPVLRLGVPVVVLPDQRYGLQLQAPVKATLPRSKPYHASLAKLNLGSEMASDAREHQS